jgi:DNA-binding IclR family transcriptional regulator
MSNDNSYFSKSLEKGLKILSLFDRETPMLTQSEIAKALGLNMTSTYRYINTLVELGFLEKDKKSKEIRPAVHCLLFCTNLMRATDHLRLIKQTVDTLHSRHNITIDVAFAVDDTLVRIYNRDAKETLTYSLPDFSKNCLHNTALGKSWLSSLSPGEIRDKVETMTLVAKTRRSITDKTLLTEELMKAKALGYAMAVEEYLPGLISIASPLVDPATGRGVGSICFDFSILQNSAEDIRAHYSELIVTAAAELSRLLPPDRK